MTPQQEAEFERKAEESFKSHRSFPNGRDYRCFTQHAITMKERELYRKNFDQVFPKAPGRGL